MLAPPGPFSGLPDVREVVRHGNCNDTMLRRSVQLLLTPENEHFEGSLHQARRNLKEGRYTPVSKKGPYIVISFFLKKYMSIYRAKFLKYNHQLGDNGS